jgi:ElaB/YqjD/DUF883 family membrane-anchored ribosome-binding protein
MSELQNFLKSAITEGIPGINEKLEIMKGVYGDKAYDLLHPEKKDDAFEAVKKLSSKLKEERDQGALEHFKKGGKKAVAAAKTAVEEHPVIAGGTAAALAAGLGALALRKRLKKAANAKK